MRYIYAPLDLTDEQSHIYKLLYQRCDFKTMIVRYTKEQLLVDSNPIFNLTEQKIKTILEYFLKENFLRKVHKGSKGHPTIYEIVTIKELMFEQLLNNHNVTAKQLLNNHNDVVIPTVTEDEQLLNNHNVTTMQLLNNQPIKDKDKEKDNIPYKEIIECLNLKANTKYRYTGTKTKELISTRWKEGNTLEDFVTVINKKCKEWTGTKYEQYLKPDTLFSNKFEGYLNQKIVIAEGMKSPQYKVD